ncbi:MAG: hypothetical protein RL263_1507 [Bacteroidota bacterium]|jgi:DNA-binding MarR family transcriptional regulator
MKALENNDNSIGYLLYHLTTALQRSVKHQLDQLDITHTQFIILATTYRLSAQNQVVNQVDIAKQSQTDKMMVSKILRTLQEKQLISRVDNTIDTRAKNISITPKGIEVFQQAFVMVKQVEQQFFAALGAQKQLFAEQLKTVLDNNQY